jgi:hypothetical protein
VQETQDVPFALGEFSDGGGRLVRSRRTPNSAIKRLVIVVRSVRFARATTRIG